MRTGVAHFSEQLLPVLAEHCEITLFADALPPSPTSPVTQRFPVERITALVADPRRFDAILYQMGNHYLCHKGVFEALWKIPGVTLLHDCVLNHFFAKYALEHGNFGAFRRLAALCYRDIDDNEVAAFHEVHGDPYRFPMAGVVAMRSRGTLVMTEYGCGIVQKEAPGATVRKIGFPYFPTQASTKGVRALREKFNVPKQSFVVTSIGHMTPAKRLDKALSAFQKLLSRHPDSLFLLAGEQSASFSLADTIAQDSVKNVRYLGYLPRAELDELMELADACINLRYPSNGEMSSSLIEMLGRGKTVIVSNYAQFAEFPDSMCVKIDIGPNEADDLADRLLLLARDERRRHDIGAAAREYIAQHHSPGGSIAAIIQFLEETSKTEPILSYENVAAVLKADPALKRFRQMIRYRAHRLRAHMRQQGIVQTFRQALKRTLT
jgi:glycosyltransferase involved in cell wall biosynthesis